MAFRRVPAYRAFITESPNVAPNGVIEWEGINEMGSALAQSLSRALLAEAADSVPPPPVPTVLFHTGEQADFRKELDAVDSCIKTIDSAFRERKIETLSALTHVVSIPELPDMSQRYLEPPVDVINVPSMPTSVIITEVSISEVDRTVEIEEETAADVVPAPELRPFLETNFDPAQHDKTVLDDKAHCDVVPEELIEDVVSSLSIGESSASVAAEPSPRGARDLALLYNADSSACMEYKIDMIASVFGACKCGRLKGEHSETARRGSVNIEGMSAVHRSHLMKHKVHGRKIISDKNMSTVVTKHPLPAGGVVERKDGGSADSL